MRVSFVGLGTMGSPMVRSLRRAGHVVHISDVNDVAVRELAAEVGAIALRTPSDAVDVDAVILMLPNSSIVGSVLGDVQDSGSLLGRLDPGTVIIDMGSSQPDATIANAGKAALRGLRFVDAPVSGGPVKAASGELSIMVGGQEDVVAGIMPVLDALGSSITRVGDVGSGHALKALNNLLSAIGMVGALEVLAVGRRFGLDGQRMLDVINVSTGRNHATEVKIGPQILTGDYQVGFSMELTVKDIRTALAMARSNGLDTPVSSAAVEVFEQALESLSEGHPDQSQVAEYLEKLYGIRFGG